MLKRMQYTTTVVTMVLLCSSRSANAQRGLDVDALAGAWRVPLSDEAPLRGERVVRGAVSVAGGYGYLGDVPEPGVQRHQAGWGLAASVRPVSWLSFAVRADGRYASQTGTQGSDDSFVFEPTGVIQLSGRFAQGIVGLGLRTSVGFHAGTASVAAFSATTVESLAMVSLTIPRTALTLGIVGGVRLGNSGLAASNAQTLSVADRLSLGLSSFHAGVVGAAIVGRVRYLELLADSRWEPLFGDGAPGVSQSPLLLVGGARVQPFVDDRFTIGVIVEGAPYLRLTPTDAARLVPVVPAITTLVSLGIRFPRVEPATAATVGATVLPAVVAHPSPDNSIAVEAEIPRSIHGCVHDENDVGVAGARVILHRPREHETASDDSGCFTLENIEGSVAEVTVLAPGFVDATSVVNVGEGIQGVTSMMVRVQHTVRRGVVRGRVASFRSTGVVAELRVRETQQTIATGHDGSFSFELPTGEYTLEASAPGYEPQTHTIVIKENDVMILNLDFRRSGHGRRSRHTRRH